MKNKIDLLLAIFLVVVSFSFTSCESEQEDIEAKFTYLSDLIDPFDLPEYPETSVTCIVNDNSLLIKKKNWNVPHASTNDQPITVSLEVEVSNDTIYVYERWLNTFACNCIRQRDENILVTNIPKGKWVVNNKTTYNGNTEDLPYTNLFNVNIVNIEIE